MEGAATECKGLTITTRGLGLAACDLCYVAASAGVAAPVYAMYRVFLGVAEAKLNACSKHLEGPMRALQHEYKVTPDMLDAPLSVPILPALIKHIIDAIDVITVGGTTYCPFAAAQQRYAAGEMDPRPENLLLSSLRETVVTLSSPETSALYRRLFKKRCPIPGAVWDEDDLLKNADEVIPEGYDWKKDLEGDMWPVHMFLISMQQKYPSMAAGPLSPTGARLSLAALISSMARVGDLHAPPRRAGEPLPEYCGRYHPRGTNGGTYYKVADAEMPEVDVVLGQVALLGEEPVCISAAPPELLRQAYEVRYGAYRSSKRVIGSYSIALMRVNQAMLCPPARGGGGGQEGMKKPEPELVKRAI
ncbi:uncharacterized protein [Choristoneura fumiferana]|uniref:uncharacterized protein n=1 Tax=Choristoneura fumiferana TaxID=7141 RepID=UPI003D154DEF